MIKLYHRRHKPGASPGTIAEIGPPLEPVRMRVVDYNLESLTEREIEPGQALPDSETGTTRWIAEEGHDQDWLNRLGEELALHPLALEDVVNVGQRTKAEEFDDSVFLVMNHFSVSEDSTTLAREQVSIIIKKDVVFSVQEKRSDLFEPVRKRLLTGRPRIRGGGSGYLGYALVDTIVDHLFPVLESIGDRIEQIETSLFDGPSPEHLTDLHTLKGDLLAIRKSVWPLRDMLSGLRHTDNEIFSAETMLYFRDVTDHSIMAVEIIETLREMVASLMDLYLSSVSNKMNEVMKVLTIIATIFMPLGFIAGLYGMNFDTSVSPLNMPELGLYWGYPIAIGVMAAVAASLLILFRRKGWI